jgi:hypothetical protein
MANGNVKHGGQIPSDIDPALRNVLMQLQEDIESVSRRIPEEIGERSEIMQFEVMDPNIEMTADNKMRVYKRRFAVVNGALRQTSSRILVREIQLPQGGGSGGGDTTVNITQTGATHVPQTILLGYTE